MKNKKRVLMILIITVLALILIGVGIFMIVDESKKTSGQNKNKSDNNYTFKCSYTIYDTYKTTTYSYNIKTDKNKMILDIVNQVKMEYIYPIQYELGKESYAISMADSDIKYDDDNKTIIIKNRIDQKFDNAFYDDYILAFDEKYKCDKSN